MAHFCSMIICCQRQRTHTKGWNEKHDCQSDTEYIIKYLTFKCKILHTKYILKHEYLLFACIFISTSNQIQSKQHK